MIIWSEMEKKKKHAARKKKIPNQVQAKSKVGKTKKVDPLSNVRTASILLRAYVNSGNKYGKKKLSRALAYLEVNSTQKFAQWGISSS